MIEVFKTSVSSDDVANALKVRLAEKFPGLAIHFDLEDCDKILRVDGTNFNINSIVSLFNEAGLSCKVLED